MSRPHVQRFPAPLPGEIAPSGSLCGNVFEVLPNFPSLAASNGWAETSLSQQPDIRLTPMQQLGNIA